MYAINFCVEVYFCINIALTLTLVETFVLMTAVFFYFL